MLMTELDAAGLEVGTLIGAGRRISVEGVAGARATLCTLRFDSHGGQGVVLGAQTDHGPVQFWAEEHEWCRWIAPLLPVPSFEQIPVDLRGALLAWTLEPVAACVANCGLGGLEPQELGAQFVEPCADAVLCLHDGEVQLRLRLLGAPSTWLRALAGAMTPEQRPPLLERVTLGLSAGWVRLRQTELTGIHAGSCVVLDACADVEHGEFWLYQDRPLASVYQQADGSLQVGERFDAPGYNAGCFAPAAGAPLDRPMQGVQLMTDMSDTGFMAPDITLVLVAEIAKIPVKLDELATLHSGAVLLTEPVISGGVVLTLNGQQIATGQLLKLGEKLAIRID